MNITANEIIKRRIELSALSDSDREWMLKGAEYFSFAAQYTVEWTSDDIEFWELFMASIREYGNHKRTDSDGLGTMGRVRRSVGRRVF